MFGPGALGYLAQNDGLEEVGRFLVRRDPSLTEAKGRFVVSVVFKGTVTHHLLEQAHRLLGRAQTTLPDCTVRGPTTDDLRALEVAAEAAGAAAAAARGEAVLLGRAKP